MAEARNHCMLSSVAPPGQGGLGQHCAYELAKERVAHDVTLVTGGPVPPGYEGNRLDIGWLAKALLWTPFRWRLDVRTYVERRYFDWKASELSINANRVVAFSTQAETTFLSARASARKILVSPTVHLRQALQWERAFIRKPIERSWLNLSLVRLAEREYALADEIRVGSELAAETFVAAGIPRAKLLVEQLEAGTRFQPARPTNERRVVYVGALTEAKGVHLLLKAFTSLDDPSARLELVGGTISRAMARLLREHMASDKRISTRRGDPLPSLQSGRVFVHASIHDGFGFAPVEALQCGLYVVVTENTGMKSRIRPGINGDIVPAGSVERLREAMASGLAWSDTRFNSGGVLRADSDDGR